MSKVVQNVECEVLIAGGGTSGCMAAINAYDLGADVLIAEKLPSLGGNCPLTGGNIMTPTDMKFVDYLNTLAFKTVDPEIIEVFVKEALHNADWIREMGGDVITYAPLQVTFPQFGIKGAGFPWVPGAEYMVKLNVKEKEGEQLPPGLRLWNLVKENLEHRKIKTMTNTRVTEIAKNEKGEVVGAIAEHEGKWIFIKAKKAVVLTTGGYGNDPTTRWEYYACKPVTYLGSPGDTGDGVRMAQNVGAGLWHMTNMVCAIGFQAPGYEASFPVAFYTPELIFVDKYGRRFMRETGIDDHAYDRAFAYFDIDSIEFPRLPSWAIFTERTRRMGPLYSGTIGANRELYEWSDDNSAEIKRGWIIQAKSIDDLAKKISVDESILVNTIATYNEYCKAGKDADFGRPKEHLMPIEGPPYYAIPVMPAIFCTQGGPRRDKEARVLDVDGNPIPRLYAAGVLGSITGFLYQGASNLAECIVFGKIAARNAVAEKSLD